MGSEEILRVIAAETDQEVAALEADARTRAREIARDARETASRRVAAAVSAAEPEIQAQAARTINQARVQLLHRRAELAAARMDTVFSEAERRLAVLAEERGPRWRCAVERLAREAVELTGPGATVEVRPLDCPELQRLGVAVAARPEVPPGVRASSTDGRITTDATIGERLARGRTILAERVAALLESGDLRAEGVG